MVLSNSVTDSLLEEERALLHLRVHLAVDEDTGIEILLRLVAEIFVLGHDALVDVADELEFFVGGVLVAEDLVLHRRAAGADGHEALNHEKVGAARVVSGVAVMIVGWYRLTRCLLIH